MITVHCGLQAAGKTTAAHHQAEETEALLIDKDTINPLESRMCELAGLDPDDRDSPAYVEKVLPHTMRMLGNVVSTLADDFDLVVDAPFLEEADWSERFGESLSEYLRMRWNLYPPYAWGTEPQPPVGIRTVWHDVDPETQRERMMQRDSPRDAWKLENWAEFQESIRVARSLSNVADVVV